MYHLIFKTNHLILCFKNFLKILTSCWKLLCHWSSLPWSYTWLFSQHYWKWRHFRKILLWRIHCGCEDYKNNFHAKITTYTVLFTTFKNRTRLSLQQLCSCSSSYMWGLTFNHMWKILSISVHTAERFGNIILV